MAEIGTVAEKIQIIEDKVKEEKIAVKLPEVASTNGEKKGEGRMTTTGHPKCIYVYKRGRSVGKQCESGVYDDKTLCSLHRRANYSAETSTSSEPTPNSSPNGSPQTTPRDPKARDPGQGEEVVTVPPPIPEGGISLDVGKQEPKKEESPVVITPMKDAKEDVIVPPPLVEPPKDNEKGEDKGEDIVTFEDGDQNKVGDSEEEKEAKNHYKFEIARLYSFNPELKMLMPLEKQGEKSDKEFYDELYALKKLSEFDYIFKVGLTYTGRAVEEIAKAYGGDMEGYAGELTSEEIIGCCREIKEKYKEYFPEAGPEWKLFFAIILTGVGVHQKNKLKKMSRPITLP